MSSVVPAPAVSTTPRTAPPLHVLLGRAARAVQQVRQGRSWTQAIADCPTALQPAVQALGLQALRELGRAQALRERLAPRQPPPRVDALLLLTLALASAPSRGQDGGGVAAYPAHTLVDQAVEAAKQASPRSAGLVNAVLRRFLREREALLAAVADDPVAAWNHPRWWIERLQADWPAHWQAILRTAQEHPPMTLRVHAQRGLAAAYVQRLEAAGLTAQVVGPQAVRLDQPCSVQRLPGFGQGDVSVQDLAAQWAAPLLLDACGAPPAERAWRVLDTCAAPGGKTLHLLELAAARGWALDLLALDVDPQRLPRVHENLARAGYGADDGGPATGVRVQVRSADAGQPDGWWDGRPFDAVLLDAPCTASGIVRRHPDVRWLRRPQDVQALCAQQRRLLDAAWRLVAPGGVLLYATCSVFRAEGEDQAAAFGRRTPDALALPAPGHALPVSVLAADRAVHDGFFYALFRKGEPPLNPP